MSFHKLNWIGIGKSVGVGISEKKIRAAKWNGKVDSDMDAVGLIREYALNHGLTVTVILPAVLAISPLPPPPRTAEEFLRKHDIHMTAEQEQGFCECWRKAKVTGAIALLEEK
jgi:hypothetical protein